MGQFHIVFLFFIRIDISAQQTPIEKKILSGNFFLLSQDEYCTIVDEIIKIKNATLKLFPMRPISQLRCSIGCANKDLWALCAPIFIIVVCIL